MSSDDNLVARLNGAADRTKEINVRKLLREAADRIEAQAAELRRVPVLGDLFLRQARAQAFREAAGMCTDEAETLAESAAFDRLAAKLRALAGQAEKDNT